jgi:membrane protein
MLAMGNLTNIFGASSSIVLLLLFVFYSAFILYYGACFTKVFATYIKEPIKAGPHAIQYKMVEVNHDHSHE